MASVRAIYIFNTENKILFSRKFPTIENRLNKKMGAEYMAIPTNDKTVSNAFYKKVIREEILQEEFKSMTYNEELEINHQKMDQLVEAVDINLNSSNFLNYSECPIVSLEIGNGEILWPCIYIKKYKIYGVALPNIDFEKYKLIRQKIEAESKISQDKNLQIDRIKKLYEEQDLSIVGSFILIENLLNYIISSKHYEENKLHTLISNMLPFGNIIETNINFMLESLNFLNTRGSISNNTIFSNIIDGGKKSGSIKDSQDMIKIPGWVTKIPSKAKECLSITIKEELKFVKYDKHNKSFNVILCDISCIADLSRNCEITLPLKESAMTNYLSNLRIHPCAKIENQNILNDATRIIFIPPHDDFKMGVFEIENIEQNRIPIIGNFSLKEANQNEVKIYLTVQIDQNAVGKFDYFYINIPLGHFGTIIDTKIMVQVGEVSLINNKSTLHWNLQNKVVDKQIVLSGSVNYIKKEKVIRGNIPTSKEPSSMNSSGNSIKNLGNGSVDKVMPASNSHSNSHTNTNTNSDLVLQKENSNQFVNLNTTHNKIPHHTHANSEFEILDSNKIFDELKLGKKMTTPNYNFSYAHSDFSEKSIYLEEMIKNKSHVAPTSDIISANCFCKIHFKLHNYSLSDIEIDKKSLLFYPKISPKIDLRRQFTSNDYVLWNNMSFNNNEINIPEKPNINLLKINIEENSNLK